MAAKEVEKGDIVWVKLSGFPHWPARIERIEERKGGKRYHMFYFGTHEIGVQKRSSLQPFELHRDKFTLYRGRSPQSLLEGVLEAEENPQAKPHDTLCNLITDAQIWMVLGPEGQEDFRQRFPERTAKALAGIAAYNNSSSKKRKRKSATAEANQENEKGEEKEEDKNKKSYSIIKEEQNTEEEEQKTNEEEKTPKKVPKVKKKKAESGMKVKISLGRKRSSLKPKGKSPSMTPTLELMSRKRSKSEAVYSGEPEIKIEAGSDTNTGSSSPVRKRRRTQSEPVLTDAVMPAVETRPIIKKIEKSLIDKEVSPQNPQQSLFSNLSKIGQATTNRTREKQLTELTKCLRYSLRASHINTDAATRILDDMSILSPVINDLENVSELNISLELVTRLDIEPEVQSKATKLLDNIKCSTAAV